MKIIIATNVKSVLSEDSSPFPIAESAALTLRQLLGNSTCPRIPRREELVSLEMEESIRSLNMPKLPNHSWSTNPSDCEGHHGVGIESTLGYFIQNPFCEIRTKIISDRQRVRSIRNIQKKLHKYHLALTFKKSGN